jgi:hypothetical protein
MPDFSRNLAHMYLAGVKVGFTRTLLYDRLASCGMGRANIRLDLAVRFGDSEDDFFLASDR